MDFLILLLQCRLEKGVIVYICDSRGVRDIYEADGSNAISSTEPLAVLVIFFSSFGDSLNRFCIIDSN